MVKAGGQLVPLLRGKDGILLASLLIKMAARKGDTDLTTSPVPIAVADLHIKDGVSFLAPASTFICLSSSLFVAEGGGLAEGD